MTVWKKAAIVLMTVCMLFMTIPVNAIETIQYQDIDLSLWYGDAVEYVTEKELFAGTSETTFSPGKPMTRAMFVTVLGRMAGVDISLYPGNSFADVGVEGWYSPYIQWAYKHGIMRGVGNRNFAPGAYITRQDMARALYIYAEKSGNDIEITKALDAFSDADKVSSYAQNAFGWAYSKGIINGNNKGELAPRQYLTRAEAAQVLYNARTKLTKIGDVVDYPDEEIVIPEEYLSVTYTSEDPETGGVASHSYLCDPKTGETLDIKFSIPFGSHSPICRYHGDNGKFYHVSDSGDYRQIFEFNPVTGENRQLTTHLLAINHIIPYKNKVYYVGKRRKQRNLELGCIDLETGEITVWRDDADSSVWSIMLDRENEKFYLSEYSQEAADYQVSIQTNNDFQSPDHHIYEVNLDFQKERKLYTAIHGRIESVMQTGNQVEASVVDGIGDKRNYFNVCIAIDDGRELEYKEPAVNAVGRNSYYSKDGNGMYLQSSVNKKPCIGYYDLATEAYTPLFLTNSTGVINSFYYAY